MSSLIPFRLVPFYNFYIKGIPSYISVSYTHLDVYKRQVLSGPRQGDKTIYAEDGRVLYGTPIEGFTVDKAKLNSLCMVGEMECFVQPVENDPSVLVLGAGHVSRCLLYTSRCV